MEIVAIARLAGDVEDEVRALAAELGTLPSDQRMKLAAGMPAIILQTPDDRRAGAIAASIASRGHHVVRCRADDVVTGGHMIEMRTFRFERDHLCARHGDSEQRLPWSEISVLLRATHRTTIETRTYVPIYKSRTPLAKSSFRQDIEAALYVFPWTAGPPWLLRELHAQYDQLSVPPAVASARNFELAVEELQARTRPTGALYDDRLVTRKGTAAEIDLLAHLLATALRAPSPAFR